MLKRKNANFFLELVLLCTCLLVGCSSKEISTSFDLNNPKYQYLFEDTYGKEARSIITNKEELESSMKSKDFDISNYDEIFFEKKDLILFEFKTQYLENDIKVVNTMRKENIILVNIIVDSPAKEEDRFFDGEIQLRVLSIEVPKNQNLSEEVSLGILVINKKYKDTYCSYYYDCTR